MKTHPRDDNTSMEGKETPIVRSSSVMKGSAKNVNHSGTMPFWSISLLAGGIAGTCAKSVIAPLERVKILFQIRSKHYPYSGVSSTIFSIVKKEGVIGLWKGNGATVARIFPYAAIQFLSFETYRKMIIGDSQKIHPFTNTLAGSLAGATSVVFTYPLDLVRVQLAVDRRFSGIVHCITTIGKEQGIKGLYKGMSPTLMGIIPYAGVNFGAYEMLKGFSENVTNSEVSVVTRLLCGGLAGAVGQTATYPLDVVRRQMQTSGFSDGHGHVHKSTWQAILTIFKHEGMLGLYKGLSINYLRVGPQVAISFTTYDTVKKFLEGL